MGLGSNFNINNNKIIDPLKRNSLMVKQWPANSLMSVQNPASYFNVVKLVITSDLHSGIKGSSPFIYKVYL